jgi:predicted nucleic acid-binding protein
VIVYVETNFLLELALQQEQHASCEAFLQLAERRAVTLTAPAFSVTEAVTKLRRINTDRQELQQRLNPQRRELKRTQSFTPAEDDAFAKVAEALIRSAHAAEQRFAQLEARLFQAVRFLPLDAAVAAEVSRYVNNHGLTPPDATVLASIMRDPQLGKGPSCFLNRNAKDFEQPSIKELLNQYNCRLIGHFENGLLYVQTTLRQAQP